MQQGRADDTVAVILNPNNLWQRAHLLSKCHTDRGPSQTIWNAPAGVK